MTDIAPVEGHPLVLSGDPQSRGRGQAQSAGADPSRVRAATIGRVDQARANGLVDAAARDYLAAQHSFHAEHDPAGLAELAGIAENFAIDAEDLFVHLHLGTLRDLGDGAVLEGDGCSAWAIGDGPDGPLVVKNRDYTGTHLGIQTVSVHSGPDVTTGAMLCVGSLGSPGAYSSGINARGLALADTQVSVTLHKVGWLRYFLMTRLLATCSSVAEALDFIRRVPHAGGGTLVLADASGAVAAVELDAAGPEIVTGPLLWRTNHYTLPGCANHTLPAGDRIAGSSEQRYQYLAGRLPDGVWDAGAAARLMQTHPDTEPGAAPLCQHGDGDRDSETLSSSVYSCTLRTLTFSEGRPCAGRWLKYRTPT
jgi:isopenicillin-N N-acyltransferase like protein